MPFSSWPTLYSASLRTAREHGNAEPSGLERLSGSYDPPCIAMLSFCPFRSSSSLLGTTPMFAWPDPTLIQPLWSMGVSSRSPNDRMNVSASFSFAKRSCSKTISVLDSTVPW